MAFLKLVEIGDGLARQIGDKLKTAFGGNAAPIGTLFVAHGIFSCPHGSSVRAQVTIDCTVWPDFAVVHDSTRQVAAASRNWFHLLDRLACGKFAATGGFRPSRKEIPESAEPGDES